MMLTKEAFDDECIKHPDALSLTSFRRYIYIFFSLFIFFAFGYSADVWSRGEHYECFSLKQLT